MITVLIPTTDRPGMLRQALRSVQWQTARDDISLVIVSENAGATGSEQVCAEFPDLPLRYVRREQPMSSFAHSLAMIDELPDSPLTAILHDDDWWDPAHLATASDALGREPGCAAYFCNHFSVAGERAPLELNTYSACWYAAGFARIDETWSLDALGVALACLPVTPCHLSALVCRTPALRACAWVYSAGNPFDTDRLLTLALSRHGSVLYSCLPHVFVRMHPRQDGRAFPWAEQLAWMTSTTERIVTQCDDAGIDLRAALLGLYDRCPDAFRPTMQMYFWLPWCWPVLERHGLPLPRFPVRGLSRTVDDLAPEPRGGWKAIARRWLPPPLRQAMKRLRSARARS